MKTLPKGHTSVLNKSFKYTNSANTNLHKTFARIRAQQKVAATVVKVIPLKAGKP